VAHNFPPLGSGGVHRPVKFARYLRELGWDVDVLTVKDIRYHAYDPSLLEELAGVAVHRAGSLEPLRLNWLMGWRPPPPLPEATSFADLEGIAAEGARPPVSTAARFYKSVTRRLFQPDDQIFWAPFAAARAARLVEQKSFDLILTTSPPESCHLVGLALKYIADARWVADFRDAWSTHHLRRRLPFYSEYVNKTLEKLVLKAADGIVANSDGTASQFVKFGEVRHKILTLPNGFDPADFGAPLAKADEGDFVVVHNGSFRGGRRGLPLLEGFALARERDVDFAARAKLYLLGINRADDIRAAEDLGLAGAAFAVGYVRHADAVRACLGADLLALAMAAEEGPALVPGKLYEYLGVGRPILAAVPPGEAREILAAATRGAVVAPPDDARAIAGAFAETFDAWRRGVINYETEPVVVSTYNRSKQVDTLAAFVEGILT
jgi:glycosyltransferase involved in cell wall biosynthesis